MEIRHMPMVGDRWRFVRCPGWVTDGDFVMCSGGGGGGVSPSVS